MSAEKLIDILLKWLGQQPAKSAILTVLAVALVTCVIILVKGVAGKSIMKESRAHFCRMMEFLCALVVILCLIGYICWNADNTPLIGWIGIVVAVVGGAYISWRFLAWGEADKR